MFRRGVPGDRISGMNLKSRRTWWVVGILVVVFIPASLAVFHFIEQRRIASVERLGGIVLRKHVLPVWVNLYLPEQILLLIPEGSVKEIHFPFESPVTDADINPLLENFPRLEAFFLTGSRITDECMKAISAHPKLQVICLDGTRVTDEGIRVLSQSRSLVYVSLEATEISDESIAHLSRMKQLQGLSLAQTRLTDKSVEILCQMPDLASVDVSGTQISEEGKRRLKDNLTQVRY